MTQTLDASIVDTLPMARTSGTAALPEMLSNRQRIWKRFKAHRLAVYSGILLLFFYVLAIFANFFAPYTETFEDRNQSFVPPTRVQLFHKDGRLSWPFVYIAREQTDSDGISKFVDDTSKAFPVRFFHRGEPYHLLGLIPADVHLFGVDEPARVFVVGADQSGHDVFSRLFFGARVSLTIGIVAVLFSYPIGVLFGGVSGYYSGQKIRLLGFLVFPLSWILGKRAFAIPGLNFRIDIDNLLMRIAEAFMSFPSLYLLLALAATLPPTLTSVQRFFMVTIIMSFIGWAGLARVIRGQVLAIKQFEYVEAARAAGASDLWIILRHIIPQTTTYIFISMSSAIPAYILAESGLSFLGLGIQLPSASWGNMLEDARDIATLQLHPWMLVAGFAIAVTIMAWNFLGDGLRDAFDVKKRS